MPRAGLTPERVTAAAARLVDAQGTQALSLSRLATDLGVAAPSLYKHVGGLEDLLGRVSSLAVAMLADALAVSVMGRSGRDALTALAEAYRRFAHEHPGLYPLTQHRNVEATRSGEARRAVEVVVAALAGYRSPEERVIDAVRITRAALHGFVDIEIEGGFARPEPVDTSFEVLLEMLDSTLHRLGR